MVGEEQTMLDQLLVEAQLESVHTVRVCCLGFSLVSWFLFLSSIHLLNRF